MRAAVVLDSWKLAVFKKHLDADGFIYAGPFDLPGNTYLLQVNTETVAKLQPTLERAQAECRRSRRH